MRIYIIVYLKFL